jgi:hypothetical protein
MSPDNSTSARAEALRDEIKRIQEEEQRYRSAKHHSRAAEMAHASRELRLIEIRAELEKLRIAR